jgi:hypothetical protein
MPQNVAVVAQVLNVLLRAVTFELQVKERQEELEARLEELEAALGHNVGSQYTLRCLEAPSIGRQLFALDSSQYDREAFVSSLNTYDTRLLTEPLSAFYEG